MKPHKFPLPKGAKAVKLFREAFGKWIEMEFDAKVVRLGLTWLRVKNGFGQRGDREDWVAYVPSGSLSVSRWLGDPWRSSGKDCRSFDHAIVCEIKRSIEHQKAEANRLHNEAIMAQETVKMLLVAAGKAKV